MRSSRPRNIELGRTYRLLLVDPDDLLRWSVAAHLHPWISVIAVRNASEAQPFLRDTFFDVVIHSAENENESREIEEQVRNRNRNLCVIRLTTKVSSNMLLAGNFLEKPFRFDDLDRILERLLFSQTNVN